GWTSNCSASCTSVRSPLIAAIATFALKADVWFRRGLLLMLSPDSRANLARCQAEAPLIALCRFPKPALMTGSITVSALFRVIEMWHPTLLIDEVDTFVGDNEELRGILNQSHRYDGYVTRTVGEDHEPRRFSVYAPVALSGIGGLADTLAD